MTTNKIRYIVILLFYSCFVLSKAFNRFLDIILLFKFLYNADFIKRRLAKFGIKDGYLYMKRKFENPKNGWCVLNSEQIILGWGICVVWGILNFTNFFSENRFYTFIFGSKLWMIIGFIVLLASTYLTFERLIHKNEIYLDYFRLFDGKTRKQRIIDLSIGIFILISGFAFFGVSISFLVR